MNLREAANQRLRHFGIEVRIKPESLVRSEHELVMTLEYAYTHLAAFNPRSQFTVLQVGAFDGVANDPIAKPLRTFGWDGILIEPQPSPFASLQSVYEGNERVQLFNVAIGDSDGHQPMFMIEGGDAQWASFSRRHLESQPSPGGEIVEIEVETCTFATVLERAGSPEIDILQIDAEGYDYELLKLFDVPRRRPAIINYEHRHLSRADRNAAAELLISCDYRLAMDYIEGDTVAYLPAS
jgi:FkbM family methyltransferase